MKLFCPGPVNMEQNVINIDVPEISHRGKYFQSLFEKSTKLTKQLFNIKNNDYSCLFLTGSGTLSIESIIFTFLKYKKILLIKNGSFAERWESLLEYYSTQYETIDFGWGNEFSIEKIEQKIKKNVFDYIFFVHHETSTTMINDIENMHCLAEKYNIKLAIDIVSSVGAYQIDLQKYYTIHLLGYSSNKFIGIFPGLAINIVKTELFDDKLPENPSYLNLKNYFDNSLKNETPFTPCYQNFYYYCESLHSLTNKEIYDNKIKTLIKNRKFLIDELSKKNIVPYIKNLQHQCIWVINFLCNNPKEIYERLQNNNIITYRAKKELENNVIQIAIFNKSIEEITELVNHIIP